MTKPGTANGAGHAADAHRSSTVDYRGRNVIERRYCHLKQWRGLATRYDKHAITYRAALVLNAVIAWTRHLSDMPYTRGVAKARCAFADGAGRTAEDKVGELLDEIERRARAEHTRVGEEQRLDALYRQQRATAVVAARDRFWEDLRATAALEQVAAWETAQRLRAFAAAKRGRVVPGAEDWLAWIAAYADRLDPLDQVLHGPSLPERPTEWSELAPYLKGWPATRPPWWSPPADPTAAGPASGQGDLRTFTNATASR